MTDAKRGRPFKRPEDRRDTRIVVKVTADELDAIEVAANGTKLTVWIREIVLRAAKRKTGR